MVKFSLDFNEKHFVQFNTLIATDRGRIGLQDIPLCKNFKFNVFCFVGLLVFDLLFNSCGEISGHDSRHLRIWSASSTQKNLSRK
jgi:hypothetical protein